MYVTVTLSSRADGPALDQVVSLVQRLADDLSADLVKIEYAPKSHVF